MCHSNVFYRFWDFPDPAKMDGEASSVKKDQLTADHPTVNCEKQASLVTKIVFHKICFLQ